MGSAKSTWANRSLPVHVLHFWVRLPFCQNIGGWCMVLSSGVKEMVVHFTFL